MLVKKTGYPQEDEVVLCKVTKVQSHGVFARLEEYENKSGLIHISEIAPGRIRNIREYVVEGKVVVCKIIRINQERGHIDLSLRRVNEGLRRKKLNDIKNLNKAEKIIITVAKEAGFEPIALYKELESKLDEYESIYDAFIDVAEGNLDLAKIGLDKKLGDMLQKVVVERVKPPTVTINGSIKLSIYTENGLEDVKAIIKDFSKVLGIRIYYAGGGRYSYEITDSEYKIAEKSYDSLKKMVEKQDKKKEVEIELVRTKK